MVRPTIDRLPTPPPAKTGWPWTEVIPPLSATMPDGHPWPRISIVTPSFNQGQFIEETIRSVLLQGYPNLEYIIIDGGSTDGTVEIIRKYEPWLTYWVSEPDHGQSHAINKGMAMATGEVCGWLCSDDLLTSGALREVGQFFATHPECRWLSGAGQSAQASGERGQRVDAGIPGPGALVEFWNYGTPQCICPQPSTFWRRSLWDAVGGLEEKYHLAMDYDLWVKFEEHCPPCLVGPVLSIIRIYAECKTVRRRVEQVLETMRIAYSAAQRRGCGPRRFTWRMLKAMPMRRFRRAGKWLRQGWRGGACREFLLLALDPWRVWTEDGRLKMLTGR